MLLFQVYAIFFGCFILMHIHVGASARLIYTSYRFSLDRHSFLLPIAFVSLTEYKTVFLVFTETK